MTSTDPVTPDIVGYLYQPAGALVLSWAFVEQALDACIAVVYQSTQGRCFEPKLPRSVKRKTRFLKLSHRMVDVLKPLAAVGLPLFSEANRLAQIRHTVVHGAISDFDHATNKIVFRMLDSTGTKHREEYRKLRIDEILKAGTEANHLARKLADFAQRLIETCMPDDPVEKGAPR
jgi:hypothetical protein